MYPIHCFAWVHNSLLKYDKMSYNLCNMVEFFSTGGSHFDLLMEYRVEWVYFGSHSL